MRSLKDIMEDLTPERLRALQREAVEHGDGMLSFYCKKALEGNKASLKNIARLYRDGNLRRSEDDNEEDNSHADN